MEPHGPICLPAGVPEENVSIFLILCVYHEKEALPKVLAHHLPYVDGAIVAHDGPCTDGSIKAAAATPKVFCCETAERRGYCEPVREEARRFALNKGATWGVILDADERWNTPLLENLRRIVTAAEASAELLQEVITGFLINRVTVFLPEGIVPPLTTDWQLRLVRLDAGYFSDVIHTNMTLLSGRAPMLPLIYGIDHVNDLTRGAEKTARYHTVVRHLMVQYNHDAEVMEHLRAALR